VRTRRRALRACPLCALQNCGLGIWQLLKTSEIRATAGSHNRWALQSPLSVLHENPERCVSHRRVVFDFRMMENKIPIDGEQTLGQSLCSPAPKRPSGIMTTLTPPPALEDRKLTPTDLSLSWSPPRKLDRKEDCSSEIRDGVERLHFDSDDSDEENAHKLNRMRKANAVYLAPLNAGAAATLAKTRALDSSSPVQTPPASSFTMSGTSSPPIAPRQPSRDLWDHLPAPVWPYDWNSFGRAPQPSAADRQSQSSRRHEFSESPCTPGDRQLCSFDDSSDSDSLTSDSDCTPIPSGTQNPFAVPDVSLLSPGSIGDDSSNGSSPVSASGDFPRWQLFSAADMRSSPNTPLRVNATPHTTVKRSLSGPMDMSFSPSSRVRAVDTPSGPQRYNASTPTAEAAAPRTGTPHAAATPQGTLGSVDRAGLFARNFIPGSAIKVRGAADSPPRMQCRLPPTPQQTPKWLQRQAVEQSAQKSAHSRSFDAWSSAQTGLDSALSPVPRGSQSAHTVIRARSSHGSSSYASLSRSRLLLEIDDGSPLSVLPKRTPESAEVDGHFSQT